MINSLKGNGEVKHERQKKICGGGETIDLDIHVLDRAMWFCGFLEPD
jgi:predicted dehydrogenase